MAWGEVPASVFLKIILMIPFHKVGNPPELDRFGGKLVSPKARANVVLLMSQYFKYVDIFHPHSNPKKQVLL